MCDLETSLLILVHLISNFKHASLSLPFFPLCFFSLLLSPFSLFLPFFSYSEPFQWLKQKIFFCHPIQKKKKAFLWNKHRRQTTRGQEGLKFNKKVQYQSHKIRQIRHRTIYIPHYSITIALNITNKKTQEINPLINMEKKNP